MTIEKAMDIKIDRNPATYTNSIYEHTQILYNKILFQEKHLIY